MEEVDEFESTGEEQFMDLRESTIGDSETISGRGDVGLQPENKYVWHSST